MLQSSTEYNTLKRKAGTFGNEDSPAKVRRHSTPSTDSEEIPEWPTSKEALQAGRAFMKRCASAGKKTLILPDKDADGLTGGSILFRSLMLLGHPEDDIYVRFVAKGSNPQDLSEVEKTSDIGAAFIILIDQGSRGGRVTVESDAAEVLLIDHHYSNEFPPSATVVTACHHEPVATSSLLAYVLCKSLHRKVERSCDWLACMGTIGDLGASFKWEHPFPKMTDTFKTYGKKTLSDGVSLLNAPRRTAEYNVRTAWDAISMASSPSDLLSPSFKYHDALVKARTDVNREVEACTHVPPHFSKDGKVAMLRIKSAAQVHPVIATRWAGHLKSSALLIVMVANEGYLPGMVNFSCRVAKASHNKFRKGETEPNIINVLESYADRHVLVEGTPTFRERVGENFARGHKQASGGIITAELFDEFCMLMEIGVKDQNRSPRKKATQAQKNTLDSYFSSQTPVKRHPAISPPDPTRAPTM